MASVQKPQGGGIVTPEELRKAQDERDMAAAREAMEKLRRTEEEQQALHEAFLNRKIGPEAIDLLEAAPPPAEAAPQAAATAGVPKPPPAAFVGRRVEEVERDLILETLSHCLGNRTRAAEMLGISIRTLRNKLHEYRAAGLPVPPVPGQPPYGLQVG